MRFQGVLCILVTLAVRLSDAASEQDRIDAWHRAGHTWPPKWQPETEGMRQLMEFREKELQKIPGAHERWENWVQHTSSRMVPKFTPTGFKVFPTPPEVHQKLLNAVSGALENWDAIPSEGKIGVIYHPEGAVPKFVRLNGLQHEIAKDLQALHEEWAGGMKLVPTSSYGVRLYQNGSSLSMHYDKMATHVISSIVHIAHEYDRDDEPWPIQIEDHDGNLHSVNLEPGQMLFYESAKCLHGRMKTFKGKYYGSIFVHYAPVDKSIWNFANEEALARVPPHWGDGTVEPKGSRWAGAALTVDSRVAEGAPHRIINGKLVQPTQPHPYGAVHPPPPLGTHPEPYEIPAAPESEDFGHNDEL